MSKEWNNRAKRLREDIGPLYGKKKLSISIYNPLKNRK